MGFETPITIQKAINEIQANKYVLPAIQREFVWSANGRNPAEDCDNLFEIVRQTPTMPWWDTVAVSITPVARAEDIVKEKLPEQRVMYLSRVQGDLWT